MGLILIFQLSTYILSLVTYFLYISLVTYFLIRENSSRQFLYFYDPDPYSLPEQVDFPLTADAYSAYPYFSLLLGTADSVGCSGDDTLRFLLFV